MKKGLFLILMLLGLLNTVEVTAQRLRTTAMFDGDTTTRPTAGMYGIGVRAAIPYLVRNTGNTRRIALFSELSGKANINNPTFTGKITTPDILVSNLTPSQLVATDASDNLVSLASSTYPSLSELAFVKGLTANAQTQLSGKFNTPTGLTTNFLPRWSGTGLVNSQIFDNGVNVGIGTNSPTDLLHINAASNGGILLAAGNAIKGIQTSTGNKVQLAWWGGTDLVFGRSTEGGAVTNYIWRTGNANADRMTLNAAGLGIGVSSPAQALHVFTATPYQIQVQRSGVGSALIGVSAQTANSTGDLLFEATQASQGFVFRSRDASNAVLNSLGIDRNGNVGIGIFSPSYRLDVSGGARFTNDVIIGGGAVGVNSLLVAKNITGGVEASGIRSSGQIQSDVTNSAFIYRAIVNQANFDLPTLIVYESNIGTISGTGTNFVNYRAAATSAGFTNVYGFQGTIASGTNRWNLFMVGTAPNHMAGSLGIGTTSLAGHGIRNSKTITGGASGFSHANYSDGQIQSDVTGAAWYFRSFANTQPTAFTLPEIRHFDATQGTIGAGSSVTVQTAFLAGSTLVGASFANYGFRGNIPAGTGRWNAFMDGTAQNYFRGNVGIGVGKTVPVFELEVEGTTQSTAFRLSANNTAPASSTATCTVGEIRIDGNFIYYCSAANTWRRAALAAY
jgi:hypothetical protein